MLSSCSKLNDMKYFEKVKNELEKNGFDCVLGSETDWSENSLIFDSGDCKILVYVKEDEEGKLFLDYYDLFEEGEYNILFDCENEETTTSHRGSEKSVKRMLKDLDLVTEE